LQKGCCDSLLKDEILVPSLERLDIESSIYHHNKNREKELVSFAIQAAYEEECGIVENDNFFTYDDENDT